MDIPLVLPGPGTPEDNNGNPKLTLPYPLRRKGSDKRPTPTARLEKMSGLTVVLIYRLIDFSSFLTYPDV